METPTSLAISLLTLDAGQVRARIDQRKVEQFAANIAASGVLAPIRVRPSGSDFQIIDGAHRYLGAKLAGLTHVPVVVDTRELAGHEITLQQLSANMIRSGLNPIDKAEGIRKYLSLSGQTASSLAPVLGLSEAHISKLLTLLVLPPEDIERVRNGTLGLAAAYTLATRKPLPIKGPKRARRQPIQLRIAEGISLVVSAAKEVPTSLLFDAVDAMHRHLQSARNEFRLASEAIMSMNLSTGQ